MPYQFRDLLNMNIHRGERIQAGRGLGNLFGSLFRGLKPLAQMGIQAGKRFLQSDFAKNVGRTALETGKDMLKNVVADVLEGQNVGESLNKEMQSAKTKIAQQIRGSGKKRKKCKPCGKQIMLKKSKFCLLD